MRRTNTWHQALLPRLQASWPVAASSRPSDLCEIELGLYLLRQVAPTEPARSLPALLTGYRFSLPDGGWTAERKRSIGIGRQILLHFKSLPMWRRALEEYRALPQRLRGYDVDPDHNGYCQREVTTARERWDVFATTLTAILPHRTDRLRPAGPGTYLAVAGRTRATVTVPDDLTLPGFPVGHDLHAVSASQAPLQVRWDELRATAQWMDAQEAARGVACPSQWEQRLNRVELRVYEPGLGDYQRSERLQIDRLLHLVGMVSSGKSTLMDVLAVWAARNSRRVTLVVGDVVTAVRRTDTFRALGLRAVPILGYSNRRRHIERLHRVLQGETRASPLEQDDPGFDYLSTACALDGLRRAAGKPFPLGDNPCDALYPRDAAEMAGLEEIELFENGEPADRACGCPFYGGCQQQRAPRELVIAPIWVATPASLIYTRVPAQVNRERLRYLELVYRRSDLVVVDEADQVQVQLDAIFCPNDTLLGGRRESWFEDLDEHVTRELRRHGRAQMREFGVAEWVAAFDAARTAGNRLYGLLNRERALRAWVERNYFTEWSLFQELAREWARVGDREDPRGNAVYQRLTADFDAYLARRFAETEEERTGSAGPAAAHPLAEVTSQLLYGDDTTLGRDAVRRWLARRQNSGDLELPDATIDTAVLRLEFVLLLAALAGRLNYLIRHWRVVEGSLNLEGSSLLLHKPPEEYGPLLPEAPMGNQLGFQYRHPTDGAEDGEMGALRFFRAMGVGRWLLLHLHELFAFDTEAGPHVLLLSGTSWAGTSPSYHINEHVGAVLMAPKEEIEAVHRSRFSFDHLTGPDDQPLSVSGKRGALRRGAIRAMLARLAQPSGPRSGPSMFERELAELADGRKRLLLLVGSYEEARQAHIDLLDLRPEWRDRVLHLEPDDAEFVSGWFSAAGLRRGEVERFARTNADFLIAPLLAMERGHNILNDDNAAALGSVYFLVRPHPHPEDISFAVHAINRFAIERLQDIQHDRSQRSLVDRSQRFRGHAYRRWRELLGIPLIYSTLDEQARRALAWSQLVSIWQVIGRLVRGGQPARVHFCDAKFAERTAKHEGADTPQTSLLLGIREALAPYFEEHPESASIRPQDRAVVHLLYAPLYQALVNLEGVASVAAI